MRLQYCADGVGRTGFRRAEPTLRKQLLASSRSTITSIRCKYPHRHVGSLPACYHRERPWLLSLLPSPRRALCGTFVWPLRWPPPSFFLEPTPESPTENCANIQEMADTLVALGIQPGDRVATSTYQWASGDCQLRSSVDGRYAPLSQPGYRQDEVIFISKTLRPNCYWHPRRAWRTRVRPLQNEMFRSTPWRWTRQVMCVSLEHLRTARRPPCLIRKRSRSYSH